MKTTTVFPILGTIIFILSMSYLVGCNKTGLPGLVVGKGQVVYDGNPLSEAMVTFFPSEGLGAERRSAVAKTDSEGKFVLRTLNPGDGVFPGDYIVTVSKVKETASPISNEDQAKMLSGELPPAMAVNVNAKPEHLIAEKYASEKTTDLKYTIPPKGDKNIKLELGSK